MSHKIIDSCVACGACLSECPSEAISEGDIYVIDPEKCTDCAACVAACPNASAMLFVGGRVSHLALLPQGQPERSKRALAMVTTMDKEGFGNCSNYYECEAVCPASLKRTFITKLNREFVFATAKDTVC